MGLPAEEVGRKLRLTDDASECPLWDIAGVKGNRGVCFRGGMKILAMTALAHVEDKSMCKEYGFNFPWLTWHEFWHRHQNANRMPGGATTRAWLR